MKKVLSLILAVALLAAAMAACGSKTEGQTADTGNGNPFEDVVPLNEETPLTVCYLAGGAPNAVTYIIDKLGGYEKCKIDFNTVTFANGALIVEAVDSWDVANYGSGGCWGGAIKDATYIIGNNFHDSGMKIIARKDSDIVAAGNTISSQPSLLGTKETWQGKEILFPMGTALHAFLVNVLNYFDLSSDDIVATHMDVANANAAFRAGNGDLAGLWPPLSMASDLDEQFVTVADSTKMGYEMACCIAANRKSYNDPKTTKAIEKYVELYYRTNAWSM